MRIAARTWRSLRRTALAAGVLAVAAGLALAASAATGFTFAGVADWDRDGHQDIVAVDSAGALWLYPGQSKRTMSTVDRAQIGRGWTGFTFAGVADWDRDRHQDIVAKDSAGVLWLYTGESKRTMSTADRVQIGHGW
jgi:hypothetical protein